MRVDTRSVNPMSRPDGAHYDGPEDHVIDDLR
jgi:hypothetical protein